ncbi:MAG TPA: hypothetical protein VGP05_22610 [Pseudonocardia sp.]|jgi:hypothetical protein|nr:hypothetical protein [Pseudonocardia sp.]
MITFSEPVVTSAQLHASSIAAQLNRITERLATPDADPNRLRTQLLQTQRDVLETLLELNAVLGGPAIFPAAAAG